MKALTVVPARPLADLNNLSDEVLYPIGAFSQIMLSRGRKLQEALSHDPLAPAHIPIPGRVNGKGYTKAMILAYVAADQNDEGRIRLAADQSARLALEASALIAKLTLDESTADARIRALAQQLASEEVARARSEASAAIRKNAEMVAADLLGRFGRKLPANISTGVYFLYRGGALQYIGQAVDVYTRINQHRRSKDFDEAKFIACKREELNDLEGFFIRLLEPPLNGGKMAAYQNAPASLLWDRTFSLSFIDVSPEDIPRPFSSSPVAHDA